MGAPTTLADNRTAHRRENVNHTANDSTGGRNQGQEDTVAGVEHVKVSGKMKRGDSFNMVLLVGVLVVAGVLFLKQ